jgi:FixJ family two-component response regulator
VVAQLLIIDDDEDVAPLLADLLTTVGYDVRVGRNGLEGLRLVRELRPDVVLLDVEMPVMSGPEMAHQLFVRDCGDEMIPLVIVSGAIHLESIADEAGTPYFLPKPYSFCDVLGLVELALRERIPPRPPLREHVS